LVSLELSILPSFFFSPPAQPARAKTNRVAKIENFIVYPPVDIELGFSENGPRNQNFSGWPSQGSARNHSNGKGLCNLGQRRLRAEQNYDVLLVGRPKSVLKKGGSLCTNFEFLVCLLFWQQF
jgi:hypothetical protein